MLSTFCPQGLAFALKSEQLNYCCLAIRLYKHVRAFGACKCTSKNGLNGEQKLLSFGPVFGLKGAISPGQSGTFAHIERAKAGKFAREFTETIQNEPPLKRFLSSPIVELLKIGGNRSCLRAKPAHLSGHLPAR